ncbi:hypothetical protein [Pseudomonas putida]|uniref:Uncharacterized protein n=1 Tax=Pseudomonas putida TaxID=303 RepID=A0A8I1JG37_PSEPU|nr:hypothetical protein [Pseudomonas putida]MBI6882427.1 hypothetical protein [Pseudomonas putida]
MITKLYRKLFTHLLTKQLRKKFLCYSAGRSMNLEQHNQVIGLNQRFYETKLMAELETALSEVKHETPWLEVCAWVYAVCAVLCCVCLMVPTDSIIPRLGALTLGGISFGIVIWLLLRATSLFQPERVERLELSSPAACISIQIPLALIQILLAIGLIIVGGFTHSASSLISGTTLIIMSYVTQYTAMSNYIRRFEVVPLDPAGVREFVKATQELYSRASKTWLLNESMEGASLNIGAIQGLQCEGFQQREDGTLF